MDIHSVPRYTLLYELPPECPFATLASSHLGEWPRYLKTRNATSVQGHEMGKVAIAVRGRVSQFICEALALAESGKGFFPLKACPTGYKRGISTMISRFSLEKYS